MPSATRRRQITTTLSVLVRPNQHAQPLVLPQLANTTALIKYLALLTALAAYAAHTSNSHSLPIPNILTALTVALPPLAGLSLSTLHSLETSSALRKHTHRLPRTSHLALYILAAFLVYETVLSTLAGTHVAPLEGLGCGLETRWKALYHAKDEASVRAVQDALACCGFRSMRDMAWPFPGHGVEAQACEVRFPERSGSCFGPWRAEERRVGVLLLVVPVGVFLWKVVLYYFEGSQSSKSWLSVNGRQIEGSRRQGAPEIEYRDVEDQTETEDESIVNEITRLNSESELASEVEGRRSRPSQLVHEHDQWRGD